MQLWSCVDTMIVAVAATQMEMAPLLKAAGEQEETWQPFVTGLGPVESAVRMGRFLSDSIQQIDLVMQFGVGGAYNNKKYDDLSLLSVCIAEREINGDLGICFDDHIKLLPDKLEVEYVLKIQQQLVNEGQRILRRHGTDVYSGSFITVNSVSGTESRGAMLTRSWNGICENMEGYSVARVCKEYEVPFLEMRVISNMVEDRDVTGWKLQEACQKAGEQAAILIKEL